MPVERFKNREAYRKNLAYRHRHGIPFTASRVIVGGKSHEVDHSRDNAKRRKINARQRRKVSRETRRGRR